MTEKRYYALNGDKFGMNDSPYSYDMSDAIDEMNRLHEENLELKHDNKRLVKFIMSKGYNLKDYIDWLKKEVWE